MRSAGGGARTLRGPLLLPDASILSLAMPPRLQCGASCLTPEMH